MSSVKTSISSLHFKTSMSSVKTSMSSLHFKTSMSSVKTSMSSLYFKTSMSSVFTFQDFNVFYLYISRLQFPLSLHFKTSMSSILLCKTMTTDPVATMDCRQGVKDKEELFLWFQVNNDIQRSAEPINLVRPNVMAIAMQPPTRTLRQDLVTGVFPRTAPTPPNTNNAKLFYKH
ncbi:hypothetical protein JHK87_050086 [Glycine soja]|nr:hypothetical protein JHK87_050086 [Glycine soja]